MAKQNNTILLVIGIIVVLAIVLISNSQLGLFSMAGATMTRNIPSIVNPGASFTVTYEVLGVNGNYGVSVIDEVTGGCTPSGEHKFVIADDAVYKTSESFTYTAPSSGSCTFSGDYKFGEEVIKYFPDKNVTVGTVNGDGNGNDINGDDNWYDQVIFPIGDFDVTLLMLLISGGVILLLLLLKK